MTASSVDRQREYYQRTAEHYDSMHVASDDEHAFALALFSGYARQSGVDSILDVGAGTGRAITVLGELLPDARVIGVEPVAALREVGHSRGIDRDKLIDGDALALDFPDNSFDFVIETGVLHHVPDPARAVREMVRVARKGVLISDSNKFGQGSALLRLVKAVLGFLGLWNAMIWLTTKGKMSKYSEGDGVFYSYSVYDTLDIVKAKFPRAHIVNTVAMPGISQKHGAAQVAVIALRGRS